ncbi:hypothetical protein [Jannaschia aquimarina]|uniref:Sulfotransferase family protein n=1 Tax=Jannaschia aquimarina TaxID=935700 RepID=A0A0D1D812_9RHOB|nr:hypothetical protein [Jannaschia aquimarina]KIT16088.1 hypothetical protein jaqu_23600 [Jannaschia aquimarina]SNT02076.1 hypothetical protein SAMN05421775_104271 [Jannaschia aquimarina]
METILHIGAHRTATSTLQRLISRNAGALASSGVAVWTPDRTRGGLLAGVMGDPGRRDPRRDLLAHRSAGRVAMHRSRLAGQGIHRLIVSDENMLGGLRENLALARLYPSAGARMARVAQAIPEVTQVHMSIRSPDTWWTSVFAFLMTRGFGPPDRATLDAILRGRRSWRHVIEDAAAALPRARISVASYEEWGHRPAEIFDAMTGLPPEHGGAAIVNATPPVALLQQRLHDEGSDDVLPVLGASYAPFGPDDRAALRAAYADDLAWLRDGADGLAEFRTRAARTAPPSDRKGRHHGRRSVAGPPR